jgi:hypothetical protein
VTSLLLKIVSVFGDKVQGTNPLLNGGSLSDVKDIMFRTAWLLGEAKFRELLESGCIFIISKEDTSYYTATTMFNAIDFIRGDLFFKDDDAFLARLGVLYRNLIIKEPWWERILDSVIEKRWREPAGNLKMLVNIFASPSIQESTELASIHPWNASYIACEGEIPENHNQDGYDSMYIIRRNKQDRVIVYVQAKIKKPKADIAEVVSKAIKNCLQDFLSKHSKSHVVCALALDDTLTAELEDVGIVFYIWVDDDALKLDKNNVKAEL